MSKSKRFYSYEQEAKFVAFVDIIGFGFVSRGYTDEHSPGMSLFTFFENCVLPNREKMLEHSPTYCREVTVDESHSGHRQGFWYNEIPLGAVNFIYLSDSLVLYSASFTHLTEILSDIYGRAIVWGVPLRTGISVGDVHHSEWIERPGAAICLYGSSLTKAVDTECLVKGAGMRVWLDPEVEAIAKNLPDVAELIIPQSKTHPAELRWWRKSFDEFKGQKESHWLRWHFDRWFSEKQIGQWFQGPNMEDTKSVITSGIEDLKSLGR